MGSSATERTLAFLAQHGSTSANVIGANVWPARKTRVCAAQGGGDYSAQMLLGRMRRQHLVHVVNSEGSSQWALTGMGWTRVRELEAGRKR